MPAARQITDSPWFWAYLFCIAALVALALISPKFSRRQAHIEREFQGRQRAAENLNDREPSVGLSTTDDTLITLQPLFFGLAAITMIAWIVFWRKHSSAQGSAVGSDENGAADDSPGPEIGGTR